MAAHTPTNAGLLLDDDDDTLVPIAPSVAPAQIQSHEPEQTTHALIHPAEASSEVVQRAVAWVASPTPVLGWRAAVFYVTGLNLGLSRRERELRLQFCALYRAAYSPQPDPER